MHYTESDVQGAAKPIGDGFESRTVLRLRNGDTAYEPGSDETIQGPITLVYTFNAAGTRLEMLYGWPLPLWALRAVKRVRSLR